MKTIVLTPDECAAWETSEDVRHKAIARAKRLADTQGLVAIMAGHVIVCNVQRAPDTDVLMGLCDKYGIYGGSPVPESAKRGA